jgi:hypothetical protein
MPDIDRYIIGVLSGADVRHPHLCGDISVKTTVFLVHIRASAIYNSYL